ncbi:hypothetical protein NC99_26750 [Sunxiuqinia dokdonensis]|uniref:Uncharacterized protein n=1 Tax=Sunxiuqinia dokdonensis TaxID=1409788 RepID=A0A0L8V7I2_9BACT|nr:hypothetical protein NC99_26750 [Sunxiuqinia dokdonensis]
MFLSSAVIGGVFSCHSPANIENYNHQNRLPEDIIVLQSGKPGAP